ncbi:MAG: hypothetical protein SVX38_16845 [Chloroflexota bacterium]|nr:hypothetical protein [Chloroflexota bacterium]
MSSLTQTDPADIHSGGRALEAAVRPYARAVAGEPLRMHFDPFSRIFAFEFRHDESATAPTEIFVPDYQYPHGYTVEISDGRYEKDGQTLHVFHTAERPTHTLHIRPANR